MMSARRERNSDIPISCDWYKTLKSKSQKVKKRKLREQLSTSISNIDIKHQTSSCMGSPPLISTFRARAKQTAYYCRPRRDSSMCFASHSCSMGLRVESSPLHALLIGYTPYPGHSSVLLYGISLFLLELWLAVSVRAREPQGHGKAAIIKVCPE